MGFLVILGAVAVVATIWFLSQRAPRILDAGFLAFFFLYAAAAVAWLLLGLVPALAAAIPGLHDRLHDAGGSPAADPVPVARFVATPESTFTQKRVTMSASGEAFIRLENRDEDAHNVAFYRDREFRDPIFVGTLIIGPSTADYEFKVPPPGIYYFRCDPHPVDMQGTVLISPADGSGRSDDHPAGLLLRLAEASHNAVPSLPVAVSYLLSLINVALGVFLMKLTARTGAARLLALGMVGTGALMNLQAHAALAILPAVQGVHDVAHSYVGLSYVMGMLLFPDGRLPFSPNVPAWLRVPATAFYMLAGGILTLMLGTGAHGDPAGIITFFGVLIPVAGIASQALRIRRAEGRAKQQARVLLWTLSLALGVTIVLSAGPALLAAAGVSKSARDEAARAAFTIFPILFAVIPLVIFAVLIRYRLWEIEKFVNLAFVYAVVITLLGALYLSSVVLLGRGLRGVAARRAAGDIAVVLSTLAVWALFRPVRKRVKELVDRVFNRRHYDALGVVDEYLSGLRHESNLTTLIGELRSVVAETLGPNRLGVWVRRRSESSRD